MEYSKPTDGFQGSSPPTARSVYGGQQQLPIGIPATAPSNYQYVGNVQPPPAVQVHGGVPGSWSTGLCDCCSDVSNCCITCWCPCITFGQIAEIVDRGSTSCGVTGALYALITFVTGCGCVYSCFYRSKMRKQYMLREKPCNDCLVHCCCECCALCQEFRELKHHGFDMSLGWQGNVDRQNQGVTMAPGVQGGMNR